MKNKRITKLERKEKEIINRLDGEDEDLIFAFNLIKLYFLIDDLINCRNHSMLINLIYIEKADTAKWVQANACNIGHRTAFRYRNLYIKLLEIVYENETVKNFALSSERKIKLKIAT